MTEIPETNRDDTGLHHADDAMTASDVEVWFIREVLPLEPALMQFLSHNWRNKSDIADLRQDVYALVCEAAQNQIPDHTKAFVFKTARNLLINRVRREQIVPIEAVTDLDALSVALDAPGQDRTLMARDELRRLQAALDRLPPRCREAVVLGRIEGLSGKEMAARMGVRESTVSIHLANGIRALANMLNNGPDELGRAP